MISYFIVKNFRSISEATLDFRYGEGKAPNGYKESQRLPFLKENKIDDRIVPCLALFGSNANGKTNLLKAMNALKFAVTFPSVDIRKHYEPNKIVSCGDAAEFELGFIKNNVKFEYRLRYSNCGILSERLLSNGKELFVLDSDRCILNRIATKMPYTQRALEEIFKVECYSPDGVWVRPFLNCLGHRYSGLNALVTSAFMAIAADVNVFMNGREEQLLPVAIEKLADVMKCNHETALAEVVDVIRRLDVDIKGIVFEEQEDKNEGGNDKTQYPNGATVITKFNHATHEKKLIFINSLHLNDRNETVVFNFMNQESEGTIRLASVVAHLLRAIYNGEVVFVDELDRSLHPLLVRALLTLFQQRMRNTKNAQLVFTTHCTDLLDEEILRLSEIGIVSKRKSAGTKVKRLCEFRDDGDDIRNVSNFRRRYLQGFYLGIPYPAV